MSDIPTGPSVRYVPGQASAQRPRQGSGGLELLNAGLSNFFGSVQTIAQKMADAEQEDKLLEIHRENRQLGQQGQADALQGKETDPAHQGRLSYVDAFDETSAITHAQQVATQFSKELADAPRDGSFDADGRATELLKEQFGSGSGNPAFDSHFLATYKKLTDPQLAGFRQETHATVESNLVGELMNGVVGRFQTQQSVSGADVIGDRDKALALAKGDQAGADKILLAAYTKAAQNPGLIEGTLRAFEQAGFSEKYAGLYTTLSERLVQNLDHPLTVEGTKAWVNFDERFRHAMNAPTTTVDQLLALDDEAHDLFRRYSGVSNLQRVGTLVDQRFYAASQKQAKQNAFAYALTNKVTVERAQQALGDSRSSQKIVDEDVLPVVGQLLQDQATAQQYPNLAASRGPDGQLVPFKSAQAGDELGRMLSSRAHVLNALGGLLPGSLRSEGIRAMRMGDPESAEAAFRFFNQFEKAVGPQQFAASMDDSKAYADYAAIRDFTNPGYTTRSLQEYFRAKRDHPEWVDQARKITEGNFDWSKYTGDSTPSAAAKAVDDKIVAKIREWTDTSPLYSRAPQVSVPDPVLASIKRVVLDSVVSQTMHTGQADLDKALDTMSKHMRSRLVTLPGMGNRRVVIEDPFNGAGREYTKPIRSRFGEAYAPVPMMNAAGETEDPMDHWETGVRDLFRKVRPEGFNSAQDFGLTPDDLKSMGVFAVMNRTTGQHVVLVPGQELGRGASGGPLLPSFIPGRVLAPTDVRQSGESMKFPEDPAKVEEWTKANLPEGFVFDPISNGGHVGYRLMYRFHLKNGAAKAAELLKTGQAAQHTQKPDGFISSMFRAPSPGPFWGPMRTNPYGTWVPGRPDPEN